MNILRNLLVLGLAIFVLNTSVAKEDSFIVLNKTSIRMTIKKYDGGGFFEDFFSWNRTLIKKIDLEPGDCMRISLKDVKNIEMPEHRGLILSKYNEICSLGNCREDSEIVEERIMDEGRRIFRLQPLSSPVGNLCKTL